MGNRFGQPDFEIVEIKTKSKDDKIIKRTTEFKNGILFEDCESNETRFVGAGYDVKCECKACNEKMGICKSDPVSISQSLIQSSGHFISQDEVSEDLYVSRTIKHGDITLVGDCVMGSLTYNTNNTSIYLSNKTVDKLGLNSCISNPTKLFNKISKYL